MLTTPRPLEEKMTLFWHGHFATEELKNDDYRLMLQQNMTLRQLATSDMSSLLVAMSKDPAMLLYLDNRLNVKGHANENYAREILELFSLGIGNYTENDIKEAARAFTGWRNQGLTFIDDRAQHDEGMKTVFGQTGNWDGEDVVDLILQQEAAGEFIAGKMYRFFVRDEISDQMLDELADRLRDDNYALKPFLRALFLSQDFYSEPSLEHANQKPRSVSSLYLSEARSGKNPGHTLLSCRHESARTGTGQSAERQGLGRRAGLAESINDSAAQQPHRTFVVP